MILQLPAFRAYALTEAERGAMLRQARETHGETVEDLAEAIGADVEYVVEMERVAWYDLEPEEAAAWRYGIDFEDLYFGNREVPVEHRIAFLREEVAYHEQGIREWETWEAGELASHDMSAESIGWHRECIEGLHDRIIEWQLKLAAQPAPILPVEHQQDKGGVQEGRLLELEASL